MTKIYPIENDLARGSGKFKITVYNEARLCLLSFDLNQSYSQQVLKQHGSMA